MPMRAPQRREAQLWLGRFNQYLAAWLQSQRRDDGALAQACGALLAMLEREPETAETVVNLCATLAHQHAAALAPARLAELARLGRGALRLRADAFALRWAEQALLQLAQAQAHAALRQPAQALRELRAIELPAQRAGTPAAALARWLQARVDAQLAAVLDAELDRAPACEHATAVVEACDALLGDPKATSALLSGQTQLFYGDAKLPEAALRATLQLLGRELYGLEVAAAARMTANTIALEPGGCASPACASLVGTTLARIAARGVGALAPLDLIGFTRGADDALCRRVVEEVAATARATGIDPAPFESLLAAAAAAHGALDAKARRRWLAQAQPPRHPLDAAQQALHAALCSVAARRPGGGDAAAADAAFRAALAGASAHAPAAMRDWRLRAELDPALALAIDGALQRFDAADAAQRIELSRLLDSLRVAPSRALDWLADAGAAALPPALREAQAHGDDLLGRLDAALRRHPATLALLVQDTGERIVFVCAGPGGVSLQRAEPTFARVALAAAQDVAAQMARYAADGSAPDDAALRRTGQLAWQALPAPLRAQIALCDTLLVVPDFRIDADAMPFELLHDGRQWLGVAKAVARVPSLEALVRGLEGARRRVELPRALALAITRAPGWPPLPGAAAEVKATRETLAAAGWDAPPIDESRVDAQHLLRRLPFVAHLHLAAHGEREHDSEGVVLARGQRLGADDVVDGARGCTPTLWLNTCVLGRSRYCGGGVVRGVAQAFVAAGAPAVVANLLEVEDAAASRLAERFYAHALAGHDFGQALRRARADLAAEGVSPLLWGSTVLIGDPHTVLQPQASVAPPWRGLIANAFAERDDAATLDTVEQALRPPAGNAAPLEQALHALARALRDSAQADDLDEPAFMAACCRVALRLHADEAAAVAAFRLAQHAQGHASEAAVVAGAIDLLRPLEAGDPHWREWTDHLLATAARLRAGERAPQAQVHAPEGTDAASIEKDRALGEALIAMRQAVDARSAWHGLVPLPLDAPRDAHDLLWNAVLAERSQRFEDMPEVAAFARQLVTRLLLDGTLLQPAQAAHATTLLAGLLKWMWDGHNRVSIEPEIAESHTRLAEIALDSLQQHWTPRAPWLKALAGFPARARAALDALDALPYDDALYPAIEAALQRIGAEADALLATVTRKHPERVPDAICYLMGALIELNTYSYLDGSVPEHLGERLGALHHALAMRAEGCLMPWLEEAFAPVRQTPPDELQRWCYGLTVSAAS